jgi:RNA polymerase sigma-70 factor (ECF subfamily)
MRAEASADLRFGNGSLLAALGAFCRTEDAAHLHRAEARAGKDLDATTDRSFDVQACLLRMRDGDRASEEELIRHIYPLVMKIVRRNRARRDAEEDVAQEIFVKVFRNLHTFREIAPFEHWVSRIAVNVCMNRMRAERSRPEVRWADLPETQADALSAVVSGDTSEPDADLGARDLVNHLLAVLSPEDRLIMQMMEMEELSVKEISSRTGWSSAFIRVRAFRARQKLNRKFFALWKKGGL